MATSFTHFNGKTITIGFINYDLAVDPVERKMVKSNPHLRIYRTKARNKIDGGCKIIASIGSTASDSVPDTYICSLTVNDQKFKEAFDCYIKSENSNR